MRYFLKAKCTNGYESGASSEISIPLYGSPPQTSSSDLGDSIELDSVLYLHARLTYSNWTLMDENGTSSDNFSLFVNDAPLLSKKKEDTPFLLMFDFVHFKVDCDHGSDIRGPLWSKYCSVINPENGENLTEMITQILNIQDPQVQDMLKWPSHSPEEDRTSRQSETSSRPYSMISGLVQSTAGGDFPAVLDRAKRALETYEHHAGYFLTRPEFTVKKQPIPVHYHQVKQLTRDSLLWSAKHGAMRPLPSHFDRGIDVNGQRYFPVETLSETAKRDYRIYENRVVTGFLDTLCHALSFMKQAADPNASAEFNSLLLLRLVLFPNQGNFSFAQEDAKSLVDQLQTMQDRYRQYFHLEKRDIPAVSRLPMQTKRFLELLPYRDIYHVISGWFQNSNAFSLGDGTLFKGRLADTLYEYYCWLQLLQLLHRKGCKKSSKGERIKYNDDHVIPPFANIVYMTHESSQAEITLYFDPQIPSWRSSSNLYSNLSLRRLSVNKNVSISQNCYSPDFLIKVKRKGQISYAVLDAKLRPMKNLFDGSFPVMAESIYKYYMDLVDCSGLQHPVKMVWLLQGYTGSNDSAFSQKQSIIQNNNSDLSESSFIPDAYLKDVSWGAISLNSSNFENWMDRFWKIFQKNMLT